MKYLNDDFTEEQKAKAQAVMDEISPKYFDKLEEFRKTRSIRAAADACDLALEYWDKVEEISNEG